MTSLKRQQIRSAVNLVLGSLALSADSYIQHVYDGPLFWDKIHIHTDLRTHPVVQAKSQLASGARMIWHSCRVIQKKNYHATYRLVYRGIIIVRYCREIVLTQSSGHTVTLLQPASVCCWKQLQQMGPLLLGGGRAETKSTDFSPLVFAQRYKGSLDLLS